MDLNSCSLLAKGGRFRPLFFTYYKGTTPADEQQGANKWTRKFFTGFTFQKIELYI